VLVRCLPPKEKTDEGVFIQEEWISQQNIGIVEAIADDVTFCKVGDRVWFERYTAIPHPEEEDLKMCRQDAVLAIL